MHGIAESRKGSLTNRGEPMAVGEALEAKPFDSCDEPPLRAKNRNLGGVHRDQSWRAGVALGAQPGRTKLKYALPEVTHFAVAVPFELPMGCRERKESFEPSLGKVFSHLSKVATVLLNKG